MRGKLPTDPNLLCKLRRNKKAANGGFLHFQTALGLFDLGFLEINMLAHDRVILLHIHLLGHRTAVLLGDIEEAGIGGRQKFDFD